MNSLGLICIVLAWALQFVFILEGEKKISWVFTACYAMGVFLLVISGYMAGDMTTANLNLLSLILSVCVMLVLMSKQNQPSKKRR